MARPDTSVTTADRARTRSASSATSTPWPSRIAPSTGRATDTQACRRSSCGLERAAAFVLHAHRDAQDSDRERDVRAAGLAVVGVVERRQEARFRGIGHDARVGAMPIGVAVADVDDGVVLANAHDARIGRMTHADVSGVHHRGREARGPARTSTPVSAEAMSNGALISRALGMSRLGAPRRILLRRMLLPRFPFAVAAARTRGDDRS